ncbi:hypothetical protein G6F43_014285 [Rhizopus delemar]|nr:hypothetical protein G6F43_014285 [Rhizopus delemar]
MNVHFISCVDTTLYKEISRHKTDTTEAISKIYDIADTTRFQAKVATEMYEELQYVLQRTNTLEEARDILQRTAEQSKRLAIFGLIQAKNQERISKNYAIDALNLPASIRHHNSWTTFIKPDGSKKSSQNHPTVMFW